MEMLADWLIACDWGVLISKVDSTVETFNGFTTFLYEMILNFDMIAENALAFYPNL